MGWYDLEGTKQAERQIASISEIDYGVSSAMSAVAIADLTQKMEMVVNPFRFTLQEHFTECFGLLLDQYVAGKFTLKDSVSVDIKNPVSWDTMAGQQKKFYISVNMVPQDPETDASTLRLADEMIRMGDPIDWVNQRVRKIRDLDDYRKAQVRQTLLKLMPETVLIEGLHDVNEQLKAIKPKDPLYNELYLKAQLYQKAISKVLGDEQSQKGAPTEGVDTVPNPPTPPEAPIPQEGASGGMIPTPNTRTIEEAANA